MVKHVVQAGRPLSGVQPGAFDVPGGPADADADGLHPEMVARERALLLEAQRIARLGNWSHDVATGHTYLSDGLRELFGLDSTATVDDAKLRVHQQDLERVAGLRDALLTVPAEPVEIEVRDHTGELTFLVRAQVECDACGQPSRLHGTVQDVTKYHKLERQLEQDRRLFDDAQRVAKLGTWEWDTRTGECTWSSMLYELFGVEPGTTITYPAYLNMVHPDDRARVDQKWRDLAVDGLPAECEHEVVRPDGTRRVFRCRGEALGSGNSVHTMIGTAQDVTEQRSTETRMQRSSKRFSDLVAVTPVGIGLFDEAERLVEANNALCALLDSDLERLRGMTATQLTHPSDRRQSPLGLRDLAKKIRKPDSGAFKVAQRVLVTSAGKPVYCELNVTVSVDEDGQRFWLVVFSDVTDRRRAAERLRYQATHDELTGLPGRAAVKELLGQLLGGPDSAQVALLFCDVDNFKRFNDSLGHDVGDELLVALARRLERGLPPSCTAARMSGDEYVVICSDVREVGGVEPLANQVAGLLRTAVPVRGQLLRVSATIGSAMPSGRDTSAADLLRFADAAMFDAKRRGPGRVSHASAAMIATANSQMLLEGQLRDALANDGLVLHYQPVVGPDGTVLSAEALVRWPHPERGMLFPGDFLHVAEQGDMLRELDCWALRTALAEAASWPVLAGGVIGGGVGIAVNLSGLVPDDPEFIEIVSTTVARTGIDWDRVVLELVETSLVDLPSRSQAAMMELVERGVRFAVDDFGTGYSSLARLKELPAQIIKIDRRFVNGVAVDASDFAVARALVDMARAMDRSCIAEGVETSTQFHVLRSVGVEAFQGWLLSKAVPARDFRELLKQAPLHIPS